MIIRVPGEKPSTRTVALRLMDLAPEIAKVLGLSGQKDDVLFPFLLLIVVGFIVWTLMAPAGSFCLPSHGCSRNRQSTGSFSFFSGRSYATGRFDGREVAVRLQQKRGKVPGRLLVIAVRTGGPQTLDANGIEAHTRDEAGRQALFTIAANDLLLSVEDGLAEDDVEAIGFVIFPGRFAEEKWRPVLEAMSTVAASLEATPTRSLLQESAAGS